MRGNPNDLFAGGLIDQRLKGYRLLDDSFKLFALADRERYMPRVAVAAGRKNHDLLKDFAFLKRFSSRFENMNTCGAGMLKEPLPEAAEVKAAAITPGRMATISPPFLRSWMPWAINKA